MRRSTFLMVIGCLFLLLPVWSQAGAADRVTGEDSGDEILTQDEAVQLALENNPDLRVSELDLEGTRTKIRQAREFPATTIEGDFDQQVEWFDSQEMYLGVSQEFEFPTRMRHRVRIAEEEVRAGESGYRLARWETTLTAKTFYQELSLAQELVSIGSQNLVIAERLHEMAREKYQLGSVGKLEVLRAGVEAATAAGELALLVEGERLARMRLNQLLNRPTDTPLDTWGFRPARVAASDTGQLVAMAFEHRRELGILRNQAAAAEYQTALARTGYYPDLSLGVARHRIDGEPNSWDVVVGLTLPVFGLGAVAGRVAEARASIHTLEAADEAARSRIELEVRTAHREVLRLAELVDRYLNVILAQAGEAFQLARASYDEGEIESLELLESQRTLQEVQRTFAESVFAANQSLINLELAIGTELDWLFPVETAADRQAGDIQ